MTRSSIAGVERHRVEPHTDARGTLRELWRRSVQPVDPLQVLVTSSNPGTLRGMHYHLRQSDIVYVVTGRIFLALLDLRAEPARPEELWLDQDETVLIPPGVGHGYATEEPSVVMYLLTSEADGSDEHGFRWDDPDAGIRWPISKPTLSARDINAGTLNDASAHVRSELGTTS